MTTEESKPPIQNSRTAAAAAPRMSIFSRLLLLLILVAGAVALYSAIHSGIRSRVQAGAIAEDRTRSTWPCRLWP